MSSSKEPLFTILSSWSQAGIGTCFVLEAIKLKGVRIVLDLGCTPIFHETISSSTVLLSHGHVDHIGAIFGHARAHSLRYHGSVPTYYVPSDIVPTLEKARIAFMELDGVSYSSETRIKKGDDLLEFHRGASFPKEGRTSHLQMNILPVHTTGTEEITLLKTPKNGIQLYLRAFPTSHNEHPSLGYVVISKEAKKKLKLEYQNLDSKEIGKLAKEGIVLYDYDETENVEFCYTGDTSIQGLLPSFNPWDTEAKNGTLNIPVSSYNVLKQGFNAHLLICEMTYLDNKFESLALERGHMHLANIEQIIQSHNWLNDAQEKGKTIIFFHFSCRHGAETILDSICTKLPKELLPFVQVAIGSFYHDRKNEDTCSLLQLNGCIKIKEYMSHKGYH